MLALFAYLQSSDMVRYVAVGSVSMAVYVPIFSCLARRWGDTRIGQASLWAFVFYLAVNYPLVKLLAFSQGDWAILSSGDAAYFAKELTFCILNMWMLKTAVRIFEGRPILNQTVVTLPQGIVGYLLGKIFWA